MSTSVAYILKRYPRYSETFVVNEILAHEAVGLDIKIFALRPPSDTHFQNIISQVRAPVTYIRKPIQGRVSDSLNSLAPTAASYFWAELQEASKVIPDFWSKLAFAQGEKASTVYQAAWLAREVKLKGITHLHAHFGTVATSVARLASHFTGVPYTFTAHAKDIFHESVEFADMEQKLKDAAGVVTVSDYNVKYLQQTYNLAANQVQRIYNGLDLQKLQYSSPAERPPLIISVGRLIEKKGLSVLMDACAILQQRNYEFQCQIVGTGSLESTLHQQIQDLGLQSCVQIIGPRPQNEVFQLVQQAAVFAAPYVIGKDGNRDGLPTVLLEAMALGTPCVSTVVTGIPEIVRDGETGLIVPQYDAEELATALGQLLKDAALRVRLSTQARSLIESEFNICRNTEVLRELFLTQRRKGAKEE
ncbi:Glycosyl transferase, group 1 [Trichormus variabilis ATCC 29413]|uniref:Glycosyl transferase, group 1 n=2 Tax=Anabaena variabilis TaxID=264691 RepID=Q3MAD6_TRIV2|nr:MULTISPECIES: glycosyltransferase [Nostocaceae]ABA22050.1 Glycosyl transferase, group 1 [Trichormus variabilis ATCC 29413]MBC1213688.1 glycosyltransferase [Trichormus variabilis ARAD]MBC1254022.1 glycosyltransferase [Trichormus variabilis V5]MBC1266921.1 glycosyltransferase [Trichormus variabilis FSR]MBC1303267.1 glycosyltransferase [Trichormus variabilis N2B]